LGRWTGRVPATLAVTLAATASAQVAVAPILIGTFGQLSLVSPVANLLAAPAVPVATVVGLTAGVVATVYPEAGSLLAHCAGPFSSWILTVGRHFGAVSWAAIEVPTWWGWLVAVPVGMLALRTLQEAKDSS
jgi:competence protein ComEC